MHIQRENAVKRPKLLPEMERIDAKINSDYINSIKIITNDGRSKVSEHFCSTLSWCYGFLNGNEKEGSE